jgi:hypothetical protein
MKFWRILVEARRSLMNLRTIFSKAFRLPFLPIVLAPFILLAPVYLSGQAMFWGTPALQFVPWWHWAWETLRAGQLPLWNPLVGMGAPLLANYQSALFYPPTWIYFLLDALGGVGWLAWGQAILVAMHLAWAGVGMALLVRRLRLGVLAQTISGLAFSLSGYLVARSGFLSINAAAAWIPWIILAATPSLDPESGVIVSEGHSLSSFLKNFLDGSQSAFDRNRSLQFLGLVICLAMQLLAGHAQTSWYTWLLAGLWVGFWGWQRGGGAQSANFDKHFTHRLRGLLAGWLRLGLALLLAISLSAVQLLPTAEYLLQSQRSSAVEYTYALQYSAWPWRFLSLLAPNLFGNPTQGDFWGYANYWEDALYVGLLPLLLALVALVKGLRGKKTPGAAFSRQVGVPKSFPIGRCSGWAVNNNPPSVVRIDLVRFLLFLILISVLLALGKNTPIFPWLYEHVPSFSMFQAPARWLIWTEFALTLLAGIGADLWERPKKRALYWTRLATAGAFAVTLGAGLAWYLMGEISPTFIRATAMAGIWGLGAGALSLTSMRSETEIYSQGTSRRFGAAHLWIWGVVIFSAADLLVAGWGLNPGTGLDLYRTGSPLAAQVKTLTGEDRIYLSASDEQEIKFKRFLRFDTFNPGENWNEMRAVLLPNLNMLDGIPSANNFDPLVPGRYARWMAALQDASPELKSSLFGLMGVGVIEKLDPQSSNGVRLDPLMKAGDRRFRWVPCAQYARDEQDAWQQVWEGNVDFRKRVVLEQQSPTTISKDSACQQTANEAKISVISDTPDRLVIRLSGSSPGWLVLSDVWYPGWHAWVDGKLVQVLKADYLFRAVQVGPGQHEVIMTYNPFSFWSGLVISLVASFLLAGYTFKVLLDRHRAGFTSVSSNG